MFKSGYVLSTLPHLEAAMHNASPVTVWMEGKIVDYGGIIQEIKNGSIKINEDWHPFLISDGEVTIHACEFRIR